MEWLQSLFLMKLFGLPGVRISKNSVESTSTASLIVANVDTADGLEQVVHRAEDPR